MKYSFLKTRLLRRRLKYILRIYRSVFFTHSKPVIVYTMGKVGSTSIEKSLSKTVEFKRHTFFTHFMWPQTINQVKAQLTEMGLSHFQHFDDGMSLYKHVISRGHPARIITLIRDPITRDMSAYFQVLDRVWGIKDAHKSIPLEDLCAGFQDFRSYPGPDHITWFDIEFARVLGIDVMKLSALPLGED